MKSFEQVYDQPWRLKPTGEHDEAGYMIETTDGVRVCSTVSFDDTSRATGMLRHSAENWKAYHDLAQQIVDDHNARARMRLRGRDLDEGLNRG